MNSEIITPSEPQDSYGLPELLPKYVQLAKGIDAQFDQWGSMAREYNPAQPAQPFAERIIQDVTPIHDVKATLRADYPFLQSSSEIQAHTRMLTLKQAVATQAHNHKLDALSVQNEAYNQHFATVFEWIGQQPDQTSLKQSYVFLERLFKARELLAQKTSNAHFDLAQLHFVLQRVIKDNKQFYQQNHLQ